MLMWLRDGDCRRTPAISVKLDSRVNIEPSKEEKNQERTTMLDMRNKEGAFFFKREWTLSTPAYN